MYGPKLDMRLLLRNREIVFETIAHASRRPSNRSFTYNLNRVNSSFKDLRMVKNSRNSPKPNDECPSSLPISSSRPKTEHLIVYDIIICELFPSDIKITSLSNGIYELSDLSELHRELLVTFLSNLIPKERLRVCSGGNNSISRPYITKRTASICSFDTCDSKSVTMDRFTGKKIDQAKNDQQLGGYFKKTISLLSYNLSTIFQDCSCNVICGGKDQVSNDGHSIIKFSVDDSTLFSYEEETVASTPKRSTNHSAKPKSITSEGEEGSFIGGNKKDIDS